MGAFRRLQRRPVRPYVGQFVAEEEPGGGFVPTQLPGCVLWVRADKGITLGVGSGVAAWANQAGLGDPLKNLIQAIAANQPTFNIKDAAYGNRPTLSFASASTQYLQSGTWLVPLSLPETDFVVMNSDGLGATESYTDGAAGNTRLMYNGSGATALNAFAGVGLSSGVATTALPLVLAAVFNGVASSVFVSANTAKASGDTGSGTIRTQALVGIDVLKSAPLNGKIAEHIIYNRALSTLEIARVLSYLGSRYAIAIGP